MCPPLMHPHLDQPTQYRVGYNNGYARRAPHFTLINEPGYRSGYENGASDRTARAPYRGQS